MTKTEELDALEARRNAVLDQMRSIRSMRRGTVNKQFLKVPQKGSPVPALRGPYYVFSRSEGGKTKSCRLSSAEDLEQTRKDVAEYHRFGALCREFEQLTERYGELRRGDTLWPKKKRRRSRSSKTGR